MLKGPKRNFFVVLVQDPLYYIELDFFNFLIEGDQMIVDDSANLWYLLETVTNAESKSKF